MRVEEMLPCEANVSMWACLCKLLQVRSGLRFDAHQGPRTLSLFNRNTMSERDSQLSICWIAQLGVSFSDNSKKVYKRIAIVRCKESARCKPARKIFQHGSRDNNISVTSTTE